MRNVVIVLAIGLLSFIAYINWDTEGDGEIDLSKVEYGVLRFDRDNRDIFGDSCKYHITTNSDIRKAERILRREFENYNKTAQYPRNHEDYGRQYMGAETPVGEVLIYVNCFAGPDHFTLLWLFPVVVHDGGDLFFDAWINVTTGEVLSFSPHGAA